MRTIRHFAVLGTVLLLLPATVAATVPSFAPEGDAPNYTDLANGTTTAVPSIGATRLGDAELELDGRLDEPVWELAQTGWGFRQADPERYAEASVPTTFKILYDDDAIYLGVACWEEDVANVSGFLSRRDQIEASDVVSIYFDPYHDRTTGYNFRVNPEGVLADAYLFDNGNRDWNWNGVWQAEVSQDDRGWYVEVRIPFSQMRFKPAEEMTWGLQVYRWMHGRGEDTGWVLWDRDQSGFVSRWGLLTGLRDVPSPRQLEFLPYFVTSHRDPAAGRHDDFWEHTRNFGADLKYGLTANLTFNATFQPDFGQVEADPALLNLSPFETWFQEKRPFFIEGARFFQHPHFNMFYSRRIGTGDPNSRIRGAAKLTGKIGGDFSVAVLGAATDVAVPDRIHNPFEGGKHRAYYGLVRVGQEFDEGNHRVNLMGTVVKRDEKTFLDTESDRLRRDGYSGGGDFEFHFRDRMYRLDGSAVGTMIEPDTTGLGPERSDETRFGTAGRVSFRKLAGTWRGGVRGHWEHDKFDPNDMGFLSAPDEKVVSADVHWIYNADGEDGLFNHADINLDGYKSWFYAGNAGYDIDTGEEAWSYEGGHRQNSGVHFSMGGQLKSFHNGWIFYGHSFEGTSKYATRTYDGERGPPINHLPRNLVAAGGSTDWRKRWSVDAEYNWDTTEAGSLRNEVQLGLRWNQSEHFSHWIGLRYTYDRTDDQWLDNYANSGTQPGVTGIGGVDYVFAELRRRTWDVTLRSNILFDRDSSLQIYLQPFYTYGSYGRPRWLSAPATHDLLDYDLAAEGRDAGDYDFAFGAVNLNIVYRWEYAPGSTVYLVWTHAKNRHEEGKDHAAESDWKPRFDADYPFREEPENTFLLKISKWFSI